MRVIQRVLVVEDEVPIQDILEQFLESEGYDVTLARNGEAALDLLQTEQFDLVLTDLMMPRLGGMDVLKSVVTAQPVVPVIVMTGYGTVQNAVAAMKAGAYDYLTKPLNFDELLLVCEKALSASGLRKENARLKKQLKHKYDFKGLIGDSPAMQAVYDMIEKVADTDSTILITGESGTGKELIARTIHYNNTRRADGPFIALNCAAIPRDLLASELFGHEKGAFTGAVSSRPGRFELAQGGTLFLDEVGEIDPALQVKLLRVLQEREFQRVGGVKTIKTDARILAATNVDLEKATKAGTFREDLFYRLNVIPIHMPPLRSRPEDIALLTSYFIREFSSQRTKRPLTFSNEAMDCLMAYQWPGNVRELENLIERLTLLSGDAPVQPADLPETLCQGSSASVNAAGGPTTTTGLSKFVQDTERLFDGGNNDAGIDLYGVMGRIEKALIQKALDQCGGVRSRAAKLLGLNRTTLIEKMKKLGIETQKTPR